jgi:hypothetical protein
MLSVTQCECKLKVVCIISPISGSSIVIIQFLLSSLQGIQLKKCPPVLVFVILEFGWSFAFVLDSVEGFEFQDYLFIENVCFCFALLNKQVVHK